MHKKKLNLPRLFLVTAAIKTYYEDAGVYVNGKYNFTADTTMNVENNSQVAGTWLWATAAGIYSGYNQENVNLDLNGKKLNINLVTDQDTAGIAAIAANSKVEIDNAGPMSVYAESTKGSNVATLFVNGGGQLFIHNGGDDAEKQDSDLARQNDEQYEWCCYQIQEWCVRRAFLAQGRWLG